MLWVLWCFMLFFLFFLGFYGVYLGCFIIFFVFLVVFDRWFYGFLVGWIPGELKGGFLRCGGRFVFWWLVFGVFSWCRLFLVLVFFGVFWSFLVFPGGFMDNFGVFS